MKDVNGGGVNVFVLLDVTEDVYFFPSSSLSDYMIIGEIKTTKPQWHPEQDFTPDCSACEYT